MQERVNECDLVSVEMERGGDVTEVVSKKKDWMDIVVIDLEEDTIDGGTENEEGVEGVVDLDESTVELERKVADNVEAVVDVERVMTEEERKKEQEIEEVVDMDENWMGVKSKSEAGMAADEELVFDTIIPRKSKLHLCILIVIQSKPM